MTWVAPREVKIAVALSAAVLAVDASQSLWSVISDREVPLEPTFAAIWTTIAILANAFTALFIVQVGRRKNWARIALLVWTVCSWSLWFLYPQSLAEFSFWGWVAAGSLLIAEVASLYLLFRGNGAAWFSPPRGNAL